MSLPGYDLWKTREPETRRCEPQLVYLVRRYSPHTTREVEDGPYDSEGAAQDAAEKWQSEMAASDPRYAEDYWTEIVERDELEGCTCTSYRRDQWCLVHGRDPDAEYGALREDGGLR